MTRTLEFHPIADLFPILDKDSIGFKALIEDIKATKLHDPVILYESKILDGRNRYKACEYLGIEVATQDYIGSDPIGYVLSVNLHRRHLNTSQRAIVAAKLASLELGANQQTPGTSIEVAAKLLNVGRASVERAKVVLAKGDLSAIEAVEQGQISVTEAAAAAKTPAGKTPGAGTAPKKPYKGNTAKAYNITTKLIAELAELRDYDADIAITAASHVVRRLQDEGFLQQKKQAA
jgi:ParB-like chromosome segregation protein Spo0J